MFGCISNYITSYYNYYFPSEKSTTHNYTHISTNTSSEIDLTKSTTQNLSTLEIQDSYKLVFSTSNNSPKILNFYFMKYIPVKIYLHISILNYLLYLNMIINYLK